MNTPAKRKARDGSLYLEKAFVGVYAGLVGGAILGAFLLGLKQYFFERARSQDIDDNFVLLASIGGLGLGAIAGTFIGLVGGLLIAARMKLLSR